MLVLTELGVDVFIKKATSKKIKPFWNSYDLIIWKQNPSGYYNKNGMFKNSQWGISEKININNNGTWKLPKQYVKYFK